MGARRVLITYYTQRTPSSRASPIALNVPGRVLQGGRRLADAVRHGLAGGRSEAQIVQDTLDQIHMLFPSSKQLTMTWSNVVKLGQSCTEKKPGQDKYRPSPSDADPELLPGRVLHVPGLHRLDGRRNEVGPHVRRRDRIEGGRHRRRSRRRTWIYRRARCRPTCRAGARST